MRKNILLVIACLLFFVQSETIAQTSCGWKQGDMLVYTQSEWGDPLSTSAPILNTNFETVFPIGVTIGAAQTARFRTSQAIWDYLPAGGFNGSLTGSLIDPLSTPAGTFGGQVLALKLNVVMSDLDFLSSVIPFGDLVIYDWQDISQVNGMSVRQVLEMSNSILGGNYTGIIDVDQASLVANFLNNSFVNGTPSQFAKDHLKKGWKSGDMLTYTESDFDLAGGANEIVFTAPHFNSVYNSSFGVVEIGIPGAAGYSIRLGGITSVQAYLLTSGVPGVLNADLLNPISSPAGLFGGDVLSLTMDIDFSDAGFMGGNINIPYGDLILQNLTGNLSTLNGLTVRQFNAIANTLLGGGASSYTPAVLQPIAAELTGAFHNGTPSQWAQLHLKKGWKQGDMLTRSQVDWDATNSWYPDYDNIYAPTGIIEVGVPGTAGYSLRFTGADAVSAFFVQTGNPAPLNADLIDPTSSSSRTLGGDALALKLNIDFSDAGKLNATSDLLFGDLILYDLTELPHLNGKSIREILSIINNVLGGADNATSITDITTLLLRINGLFVSGTPSQFAQLHLLNPNCDPAPTDCGWKQNDLLTRTQLDWDGTQSWHSDYNSVYLSTFGLIEIGVPGSAGFSIQFTGPDKASIFFVQTGAAAILNADLVDPTSSSSGGLGGDVLALKLNVDLSKAGHLGNSNLKFGELILYNFKSGDYISGNNIFNNPLSQTQADNLNGKTVAEVLTEANIILGGGTGTFALSLSQLVDLVEFLNFSFSNGTPQTFAKDHLKKPWKQDDIVTFPQGSYGADPANDTGAKVLSDNFANVYGSFFEVGIPSTNGFSIVFTSVTNLLSYLPQTAGSPAALDRDLVNPTGSSSGPFGGQVAALKLNVDFNDNDLTGSTFNTKFGDLVLHDLSIAGLNGLSVRAFLNIAINALGGASTSWTISDLYDIATLLNRSFAGGDVSQFANEHLITPCEAANTNHCPVATAASVTTKIGSAINIQLQATDADNNALSYSISQNASNGSVTTSANGAAIYTPTAGYYGADEFKFKANDGKCDGEATVTVTIVKCPSGKGNWINKTGSWPASATPMLLGTQSYTKQQLITILNTPVGTGSKADASLILAHQLITAKLNVADGAVTPANISNAIAAADALIGNNRIPMKIRPNTTLGQQMVTVAALLESYNKALLTTACQTTIPVTINNQQNVSQEALQLKAEVLDARLYPNPSTSYFNVFITSNDDKEKIAVQVFDQYGRLVSARNNISNGSMVRIGDLYQPGVYYVRVLQGRQHKELKLVKL